MGGTRAPWLAGYRGKIVDGNCLAASEHRIQELRAATGRAAPHPLWVVAAHGQKHLFLRLGIKLNEATRDGAAILHSLTHVPRQVSAPQVADLYRKRWTLETAFKHLEAYFHSAINT